MKTISKSLLASGALVATQAQAAVDVSGFTVGGASGPYGLILLAALLAAIGLGYMGRTS